MNQYLPVLLSAFLVLHTAVFSQNATTPGAFESYSTVHSVGFEWDLTGDDNHNAVCPIQFRELGTTTWQDAMPLYRVDFEAYNMMAGSILFLQPGTAYEVMLALSDPDGGNANRLDTVATRIVPMMPSAGNTYYVIPGAGGGDGSQGNPFQGVDAAEAVAQPGDIMLLQSGNYGGTVFFNAAGAANNHIVWKADTGATPIFEGVRIEADHLWFEGITVVDQQYGLRTSPPGPVDVVVTRCEFYNNHYSIFLNDGGTGWFIADNIIVGDNDPSGSNFSGEGIELQHTNGHTVCYNRISRTADGISYPTTNVDIFGNDIFSTSDDGIEGDYGHANVRIWGNRITNPRNNGISFQPMDGAPWYVLFNQVAVLNESVMKLRDRSDRALIAHNTFLANSGPIGSGTGYLRNMEVKNNLWVSIQDRYVWEESQNVPQAINWKTDFDYNGFDWGSYPYAFKWDNFRYDDIQHFTDSTGQEVHGIQIDRATCFDSLNYAGFVDSFFIEYNILDPGCNAVDAGVPLSNINDDYIGSAPDLGAHEVGKQLAHYGPRDSTPTTTSVVSPIAPTLSLKSFPNPFEGETAITYELQESGSTRLVIYDLLGRAVTTLVDRVQIEGTHRVMWYCDESGVYLCRLAVNGNDAIRKLVVR